MSIDQNNPKEVFQKELQNLHSAVKDAAHEYHLFTIATSSNNIPEIYESNQKRIFTNATRIIHDRSFCIISK